MKEIELVIDESKGWSGVNALSVVYSPAIDEDFIALSKHEVLLKEIDQEKRLLMGPALIPDKKIFRKDDKLGEYNIFFKSETIRKASELFMQKSNQNNATYEHEAKLEGMTVVESWIIDDPKNDKATKLYGFDLPQGTWMVSMKVHNDDVWNDVKLGKVKGFSIEGKFADRLVMSSQNEGENPSEILEKIRQIIENANAI